MTENDLFSMDTEALKQFAETSSSRTVKRRYVKMGYTNMMSLYGALHNKEENKTIGARIEIMSNTRYTKEIVWGIYDFFNEMRLLTIYSIWLYDISNDSLKLVWDGKEPIE